MAITISTVNYEFSHGKKPRGFGHWYFEFSGTDRTRFYQGNYGEAKKNAIAQAKVWGCSEIKVGA